MYFYKSLWQKINEYVVIKSKDSVLRNDNVNKRPILHNFERMKTVVNFCLHQDGYFYIVYKNAL